jgi:very-short-patch-repair endonuclease
MVKKISKPLLSLSRRLRLKQTPWETKVWARLRAKRISPQKFKRQYPIGNYIVDFYCAEKRLIIEIDGSQHDEEKNRTKDQIRDKYLKDQGFKVLRFKNNEIDQNLEGVFETIGKNL